MILILLLILTTIITTISNAIVFDMIKQLAGIIDPATGSILGRKTVDTRISPAS